MRERIKDHKKIQTKSTKPNITKHRELNMMKTINNKIITKNNKLIMKTTGKTYTHTHHLTIKKSLKIERKNEAERDVR